MKTATDRLVQRTVRITKRRPPPPRELLFDSESNLLTWQPPQDTRMVTHYRIRIGSDAEVPMYQPPVGQTTLQLTPGVNRVFVTSYSQIVDLESTPELLDLDPSGGGGGGGTIPDAPPVTIPPLTPSGGANPRVREIYDGKFEVTVYWGKGAGANAENFRGVAVYLEDEDISEKPQAPMNGTVKLGSTGSSTAQVSGQWAPVRQSDSFTSPAVLIIPGKLVDRKIRIYLQAFGKATNPVIVRANQAGATPSVQALIPAMTLVRGSGEEYAWLVTDVSAEVIEDFDNPAGPKYSLKFDYKPPDQSLPLPPGMRPFGGVMIVYQYLDGTQKTEKFLDVADVNHTTWTSAQYDADDHGGEYKVYFVSRDVDGRVNDLVPDLTPFDQVLVDYPPGGGPSAPYISDLVLSNYRHEYQDDGTDMAKVDLTWTNPDTPRFASVEFFRTGVTPPRSMHQPSSPPVTSVTLSVIDWPLTPEDWTIVAISKDQKGNTSDSPASPRPATPRVVWRIGPAALGTPGGGIEYAPIGGINGTTVTPEQEMNADGVMMMRFKIGVWQNPSDPIFGGMSIGRVFNGETTWWDVPKGETSFVTDWEPAPTERDFDFYFVSRDMKGHRNSINPAVTPHIRYHFVPVPGQILASRLPRDWFNEAEFEWPAGDDGKFTVERVVAPKIFVGSILRVGGGVSSPPGTPGAFEGLQNGQIAVYNSSNQIRAWMGEQTWTTPGDALPHTILGAWFKELYVGGDNPTNAPLYANQYGAVIVGGFEMDTPNQRYPYIGIRDNTGTEVGRIGARIGYSPAGNQGGPEVTIQGAWFREFAYGGTNFADWRMLAKMDPASPLQATVQMRNIDKFTIDYMADYPTPGNPRNARYQLEYGFSAFVTDGIGDPAYWKFPGLILYRGAPTNLPTRHGIAIINRGIVLRGPNNIAGMNGRLGSFVTFNGDNQGLDNPNVWWCELTMYSPQNGQINVQLNSGNASNGASSFALRDGSGNENFSVDTAGNVRVRGTLSGVLGSLNLGNLGAVNCTSLNAGTGNVAGGSFSGGSYSGTSLTVTGNVSCNTLSVTTFNPSSIQTNHLNVIGDSIDAIKVNSIIRCKQDGVWLGGVQCVDHVFGYDFGISEVSVGWPQTAASGVPMPPGGYGPGAAQKAYSTFLTGDGRTVYVCGGLIVNVK